MAIVGAKPRPRALIQGFEDASAEKIAALFPTSRRVVSLEEVRQAEWDLLVSNADSPLSQGRLAPHMYAVAFGVEQKFRVELGNLPIVPIPRTVGYFNTSVASEFDVPDDLPTNIGLLVVRDLLPFVQGRLKNDCLAFAHSAISRGQHRFVIDAPQPVGRLAPFLRTADGKVLAGALRRFPGQGQCWLLPDCSLDVPSWVRAAVSAWHKKDPARFPFDFEWKSAPRWMTARQEAELAKLMAVREQGRKMLAEWRTTERAALDALAKATVDAESSERQLLTEQGEPLVKAVLRTLGTLGFAVEDMDKVFPENDRREDLRVKDAQDASWVALVEVRGYHRGAAMSDLQRLDRFARRLARETGRDPTRLWYVVNQFIARDPDSRAAPLKANPVEVEVFAEDGGLVIDTTTLFQLVKAIQSGRLSTAIVRDHLKASTGSLTFPAALAPAGSTAGS
jgi:hypothetical protein